MIGITTTYTVRSHEVRAGLRLSHPANHEKIRFEFFTVCEQADPQRWHGEVVFAGTTLMSTPSFDDENDAGRAAEKLLEAKIVEVFA